MHRRQNPAVDTDAYGRLKNPHGGILWVHTTDTPAADFTRKGFAFRGDTFYLSSGGDESLVFGKTLLFLTYRPTKIFNPEDPKALDELWGCILSRTSIEALRNEEWLYDLPEDFFKDEAAVADYIRGYLAQGYYTAYEAMRTVRPCISHLGYTARFETENIGFDGDANIAVSKVDFPRLQIVAALDPADRDAEDEYLCPRCGQQVTLDELVAASQIAQSADEINCGCISPPPHSNPSSTRLSLPAHPRHAAPRPNPRMSRSRGYLINPETGGDIWFHGSAACRELTQRDLVGDPETDHVAFFVSSNREYADAYASLNSEGDPNECQGLYEIRLRDSLRLFHADELMGPRGLTREGLRFLSKLVEQNPEHDRAALERGLLEVAQSLDWSHFVDVEYYEGSSALPPYAIVNAIIDLGYGGWVERRTTGLHTTLADVAVLHSAISNVEIVRCVYFGD